MRLSVPEKTRLVIFDLDGTLYDKKRLPFRLILSQLTHLGMLGAERKVRSGMKGLALGSEADFYNEFYCRIAARCKHSAKEVREWYENSYMPAMARVLKRHYSIRDFWPEAIRELRKKGIKTAVLSDYGSVPVKLAALGFDASLADAVFSCPEFGALKPAPEPFLGVAAKLGVSPAECLAIGDRPDTDGLGARAAGMACLIIDKQGNLNEY